MYLIYKIYSLDPLDKSFFYKNISHTIFYESFEPFERLNTPSKAIRKLQTIVQVKAMTTLSRLSLATVHLHHLAYTFYCLVNFYRLGHFYSILLSLHHPTIHLKAIDASLMFTFMENWLRYQKVYYGEPPYYGWISIFFIFQVPECLCLMERNPELFDLATTSSHVSKSQVKSQ